MSRSPHALRTLVLVVIALALWLVREYLDALLIAGVTCVLTWPLYQWTLRRCRGREPLAAFLTTLLLAVGVVVPAGPLLFVATREVGVLLNLVGEQIGGGRLDTTLRQLDRNPGAAWLSEATGVPEVVSATVRTLGTDAAVSVGHILTEQVPSLLGVTAQLVLHVVIFFVAVYSVFSRGVKAGRWVLEVSPLEPEHLERLYSTFVAFARNVVFAGVVCATVQGLVAGLGYALAGVERPMLFGMISSVLAFIPLVGTALVWGPLTVLLVSQDHMGAAIFLVLWSLVLTSSVDNLIRPFLVRGRSNVPLLLIFLGVFGGLGTMGLIGVLVGPTLMAMLLALLRIYHEVERPQLSLAAGAVEHTRQHQNASEDPGQGGHLGE